MKLKIAFAVALMGWTSAFGQQVILDNLFNTGSSSATSGGLVYESLGPDPGSTTYPYTLFDGLHYSLGITVWGGSSMGTMALMGTYTPANDPKGYTGIGPGTFALGSDVAVTVPGVGPGQTAWIELQIWDGENRAPLAANPAIDRVRRDCCHKARHQCCPFKFDVAVEHFHRE